ncbi:MAG TPA: hypothetical protein VGL14_21555 [Methylomirabilota bacterium]
MTNKPDAESEKAAAERKFLIAMAAEARAERELREKIQKWFYVGAAVFVVLFIIGMLFF